MVCVLSFFNRWSWSHPNARTGLWQNWQQTGKRKRVLWYIPWKVYPPSQRKTLYHRPRFQRTDLWCCPHVQKWYESRWNPFCTQLNCNFLVNRIAVEGTMNESHQFLHLCWAAHLCAFPMVYKAIWTGLHRYGVTLPHSAVDSAHIFN